MRIPKVLLTYIGCVFDAFLCVLADLSEHMHAVPDFFRRKSPEHIVCKLFLSADSILNDFIGRILQMNFHMLPVLLIGFPGNKTSVFKHLQCRGDMRFRRLADSDDIGCSPIRRIVLQKHENVVFHLAKLVFLAYGRHQNLRETFLRPEKKTSILTHIAVYERSGLGHQK